MDVHELKELCSLGESTTVQYKLDFMTQKELDALDSTTQKRILEYLKTYPKATRVQVAEALGDITEDGVKFNLGVLQQHGYLRRDKGRKKGHWVVIDASPLSN